MHRHCLGYVVGVSTVIREGGVTRVQRTFAFVDVSGFIAYTDLKGDAAAVDLLETVRGSIRRLSSVHGVRIAKWLGDGAMIVGVEPEPVVEAVVAMIEANQQVLSLRAGVAQGDVILFEGDDHIGQAVNLASRLSDLAKPGEILAPVDMQTSLLVNTKVTPIGHQRIAGMATPVPVVRLEPDRI